MTEILGWMMVALLGCTCIMGILVSCLKDVQIKRIRRWRKRKSRRLLRNRSRKHGGAKYESIVSTSAEDSDINVNDSMLDQLEYEDEDEDDSPQSGKSHGRAQMKAVAYESKVNENNNVSVSIIEEEEAHVAVDDEHRNEGFDLLEANFPVEGNQNKNERGNNRQK